MEEDSHYQHPHLMAAAEYEEECAVLYRMCMESEILNFDIFCELFMKTRLRFLDNTRMGPLAAKLAQILLYIGKKYFVRITSNCRESAIGAYMVYVFLALQPDKRIAFMKIHSRDIAMILWINTWALTHKNNEILFILKKILTGVPRGYEKALRCYGIVHPRWEYDPTPVDDLDEELEDLTSMYKMVRKAESQIYSAAKRRRTSLTQ